MSDGVQGERESPSGVFAGVEARLRDCLACRDPTTRGDLDPRGVLTPESVPVPAAVLVLLERVPGWSMVFTKRTTHVDHHKGEVSFAGGMSDPDDDDARATALREAEEELGLPRGAVSVLGELDRMVTVTQFLITPVVAAIDAGHIFQPSAAEVDKVLRVPLSHLRDATHWFEEDRTWRGRTYRLRACRFEGDVIWGATSRILQNFLEIVPPDVL